MSVLFDRIVIAVPDLSVAAAEYGQLLGSSFCTRVSPASVPSAWLALANTVIELQQQSVERATISGFILADASKPAISAIDNERNLSVGRCDGGATKRFRAEQQNAHCISELKVDHLVLHTASAEACIDLFQRHLGLRLALDKAVPEWGGRMLFFRSGKLTLEVIEPSENKPAQDYFWGIAYQCTHIDQFTARLKREQVDVSPVRDGRKPNTKVATIKSHNLEIPTLLVQPAS